MTDLLENPTIEIEGKTYAGMPLEEAPAGRSHHHSYPGGLIEHIVSSTNVALALCDTIRSVYHGKVDRDTVVAGVLLHDIFKALTYTEREDGSYGSTPLAERLDHLTLGVANSSAEVFHSISCTSSIHTWAGNTDRSDQEQPKHS